MPIYEFVCESCGRQSSVFQRSISADLTAACPHCQSTHLRRLVSRFAVLRSANDAFDDRALDGLNTDDPEAMSRWARRMGEEMGEDLGPEMEGAFDDSASEGEFDGFGDDLDD